MISCRGRWKKQKQLRGKDKASRTRSSMDASDVLRREVTIVQLRFILARVA